MSKTKTSPARKRGEAARVAKVRELLPFLAWLVRAIYPDGPIPAHRALLLDTWRALSGVPEWTPRMVAEVERRIR